MSTLNCDGCRFVRNYSAVVYSLFPVLVFAIDEVRALCSLFPFCAIAPYPPY